MQLSISLRRVATVLVVTLVALTAASLIAEYLRFFRGSESELVDFFSLTEEKNLPTWWSSLLLAACAIVLGMIAATKSHEPGEFRRHWVALAAIFGYMSLDEFVEIHEWLTALPWLHHLHGAFFYSWVIPVGVLVAVFALSYLRFLLRLPRETRTKVAWAGVLYVGGALGVELLLGLWAETHDEQNFTWALIDMVEESLEIVGSSLFLYALLEYLGRSVPDLRIAIRSGRD